MRIMGLFTQIYVSSWLRVCSLSQYSPAASPVSTLFPHLTPLVLRFLEVKVSTWVASDQNPLRLETANGNSNGIVNSSSVK